MSAIYLIFFHVALIIVVLFVARGDSLTCYKCTSEKSLDDCNSKQTEVACPNGTTHCLTGKLKCTAGEIVTKIVYMKRCSNLPYSDMCETTRKDTPQCPTSSTSWSHANDCCYGNNCNSVKTVTSGTTYSANSGTSHSINRVLLGACFALIFWAQLAH